MNSRVIKPFEAQVVSSKTDLRVSGRTALLTVEFKNGESNIRRDAIEPLTSAKYNGTEGIEGDLLIRKFKLSSDDGGANVRKNISNPEFAIGAMGDFVVRGSDSNKYSINEMGELIYKQ